MDYRYNLDSAEAAELLGVTEQTLWNWRWSRRGPDCKKQRGRLWYSEAGILRYQMLRELSGKPARHGENQEAAK